MLRHLQASYFSPSHQHDDSEPVCWHCAHCVWGAQRPGTALPWPSRSLGMVSAPQFPCTKVSHPVEAVTLLLNHGTKGSWQQRCNHWGSLAANGPLGNPWFMICHSSYVLISSPWGEGPKANNAESLSAETFAGEWTKSDWGRARFSEVLCPVPRWRRFASS